jgi:hypothetical protein
MLSLLAASGRGISLAHERDVGIGVFPQDERF